MESVKPTKNSAVPERNRINLISIYQILACALRNGAFDNTGIVGHSGPRRPIRPGESKKRESKRILACESAPVRLLVGLRYPVRAFDGRRVGRRQVPLVDAPGPAVVAGRPIERLLEAVDEGVPVEERLNAGPVYSLVVGDTSRVTEPVQLFAIDGFRPDSLQRSSFEHISTREISRSEGRLVRTHRPDLPLAIDPHAVVSGRVLAEVVLASGGVGLVGTARTGDRSATGDDRVESVTLDADGPDRVGPWVAGLAVERRPRPFEGPRTRFELIVVGAGESVVVGDFAVFDAGNFPGRFGSAADPVATARNRRRERESDSRAEDRASGQT